MRPHSIALAPTNSHFHATRARSVRFPRAASDLARARARGERHLTMPRISCFGVHSARAANDDPDKMMYTFKRGEAEGTKEMKHTLGGKGAGLQEIAALGLNVPPGFTITTSACERYQSKGESFVNVDLWPDVLRGITFLEKTSNRTLFRSGCTPITRLPLFVSVRSGAAASMPGMMDSVLDIGFNDEACEACITAGIDARFVYDSYRRLLHMFGDVVEGIPSEDFARALDAKKNSIGASTDAELTSDALRELCDDFKRIYEQHKIQFEQNPLEQLRKSIVAVFKSWNNPRAVTYRKINNITTLRGTAVNVQQMAYGNLDDNSGSGVCFTRNPATGQNVIFGEFLLRAQGEDVVSGARTPIDISQLSATLPDASADLKRACAALESSYSDMMDVEFTIESGTLFVLQCRVGKRTGAAAVRIATEMAAEGCVTRERAITMVPTRSLEQCLHPVFTLDANSDEYVTRVVTRGLSASPGAAVGAIVFNAKEAEKLSSEGKPCILVREETSAEDVGGMWSANGILTSRGGMTSHAAVVARGWGKPCVVGASGIHIKNGKELRFDGSDKVYRQGHVISINGATGEVLDAKLDTRASTIDTFLPLKTLMAWCDDARRLDVRANADTIEDALEARAEGAHGVGLVRSEHMFFGTPERVRAMRAMVVAQHDESALSAALETLKKFQYDDFYGVLKAFAGYPVTIRLLDPPLHEFMPSAEKLREGAADEIARDVGKTSKDVMDIAKDLQCANPMLALRGCRLGIVRPAISTMQVRAVVEAAMTLRNEGVAAMPEIMIPLVSTTREFTHQRDLVLDVIRLVAEERQEPPLRIAIGAMIETPRAAFIAGELVREGACFFSFGTNDLTQTTFAMSRDDSDAFVAPYKTMGILSEDPFVELDDVGVGELMRITISRSRAQEIGGKSIEFGVCGEHAADPASLRIIDRMDVGYISVSSHRVLVARLAAAQASIANGSKPHARASKHRHVASHAA